MSQPREVMAIPVPTPIDAPRIRPQSFDLYRLTDTVEALATVGVAVPSGIARAVAHWEELKRKRQAIPADLRAHSVSVTGQIVSAGEAARTKAREREEAAYAAAAVALQSAAPDLVEALRERLGDTLDRARAVKVIERDPIAETRYEGIYAAAKWLRILTGDLEHLSPGGSRWLRFREPGLVWRWQLEEARCILGSRKARARARSANIRVREVAVWQEAEQLFVALEPSGLPVDVYVAARNADAWKPDVVTAAEVLEAVARHQRPTKQQASPTDPVNRSGDYAGAVSGSRPEPASAAVRQG